MHKSIDILVLKHKFKQKLLIFSMTNSMAYSSLIFTNCTDFKVGLRNTVKF